MPSAVPRVTARLGLSIHTRSQWKSNEVLLGVRSKNGLNPFTNQITFVTSEPHSILISVEFCFFSNCILSLSRPWDLVSDVRRD